MRDCEPNPAPQDGTRRLPGVTFYWLIVALINEQGAARGRGRPYTSGFSVTEEDVDDGKGAKKKEEVEKGKKLKDEFHGI